MASLGPHWLAWSANIATSTASRHVLCDVLGVHTSRWGTCRLSQARKRGSDVAVCQEASPGLSRAYRNDGGMGGREIGARSWRGIEGPWRHYRGSVDCFHEQKWQRQRWVSKQVRGCIENADAVVGQAPILGTRMRKQRHPGGETRSSWPLERAELASVLLDEEMDLVSLGHVDAVAASAGVRS